jgi:hypothetical protein
MSNERQTAMLMFLALDLWIRAVQRNYHNTPTTKTSQLYLAAVKDGQKAAAGLEEMGIDPIALLQAEEKGDGVEFIEKLSVAH